MRRRGGNHVLACVVSLSHGRVVIAMQVKTAWKVWRTWSDSEWDTGLKFDDSHVQNTLAPGLVDCEKVPPAKLKSLPCMTNSAQSYTAALRRHTSVNVLT